MRTAFRRIDIIDKTEYTLVIRIVMLERNFHINIILFTLKIQNVRIERLLALIQISDKLLNPALIIKFNDLLSLSVIQRNIMGFAYFSSGKGFYLIIFICFRSGKKFINLFLFQFFFGIRCLS